MAVKFYKCSHCGNVVVKMVDSGVPIVCCGKPMDELVANTVDASAEKHVPHVVEKENGLLKIEIGFVHHPMTPEHHIAFVYVETEDGCVSVNLKNEPVAEVCIGNRKAIAVYEYCNLHGLWKRDL